MVLSFPALSFLQSETKSFPGRLSLYHVFYANNSVKLHKLWLNEKAWSDKVLTASQIISSSFATKTVTPTDPLLLKLFYIVSSFF